MPKKAKSKSKPRAKKTKAKSISPIETHQLSYYHTLVPAIDGDVQVETVRLDDGFEVKDFIHLHHPASLYHVRGQRGAFFIHPEGFKVPFSWFHQRLKQRRKIEGQGLDDLITKWENDPNKTPLKTQRYLVKREALKAKIRPMSNMEFWSTLPRVMAKQKQTYPENTIESRVIYALDI